MVSDPISNKRKGKLRYMSSRTTVRYLKLHESVMIAFMQQLNELGKAVDKVVGESKETNE